MTLVHTLNTGFRVHDPLKGRTMQAEREFCKGEETKKQGTVTDTALYLSLRTTSS